MIGQPVSRKRTKDSEQYQLLTKERCTFHLSAAHSEGVRKYLSGEPKTKEKEERKKRKYWRRMSGLQRLLPVPQNIYILFFLFLFLHCCCCEKRKESKLVFIPLDPLLASYKCTLVRLSRRLAHRSRFSPFFLVVCGNSGIRS